MSSNNVTNDTGGNRPSIAGRVGNYRWVICALLFFCTTINYIDRNSLSVLKTTLQGALGWTDVDYGWITTAFTFAYAMFPSLIGVFIDRFGVKKALAARADLVVVRGGRARPRRDGARASSSCASSSASPRRLTSRRRSRPWACGSRRRSGRSPPASSTPAPASASSSRASSCGSPAHWGWQMRVRVHRRHRAGLAVLLAECIFDDPEHQTRLGKAELDYIRAGSAGRRRSRSRCRGPR